MWDFFTQMKMDYFRDYLKLIKESVEKDLKKLDEENQKYIKEGVTRVELEDGDYYDPYENLADQAFQIEEYEQLMLSTFVIGVFVFMEDQFNDVCHIVQKENDTLFSYKDLKGGGVSRSLKYLEKVLGKKLLSTIRNDFEVAQTVRNSLVHSDGLIPENLRAKIVSYTEQHPNRLKINQHHKIKITPEYADFLLKLAKEINAELGSHIPKNFF